MKMIELQDMMKLDAKVNRADLTGDSLHTPIVQSKYVVLHANERGKFNVLRRRLRSLEKDTTDYFAGRATAEVYAKKPFHENLTKAQQAKYVEADPDVMALQDQVDMQEIKVDMIREYIYTLNQRTWHIKTAVEMIKFENGIG